MTQTPNDLDTYIATASTVLELTIAPEWLPAVKSHLEVILTNAISVQAFPLPDEIEPAFIFEA